LKRFDGVRVVVTGAADGIGRATAIKFTVEGAVVLAVDVNASGLQATAASHGSIKTLIADVTAPDAAELICSTAARTLGGIDVLINNAGIAHSASIETHTDADWQRVLDINLHSVFRITRRAIAQLKASGRGRIVNIGSVMSQRASPGMGAYTVSKHAIAGLTKTLALELGVNGITANYIQPGAIVTGITRGVFAADAAFREFWTEKAAVKRLGQPEDIANAIAFLASDEAAFITGHGLLVDGGALQSP
jgi:NAD(P)-dependent dehydrogenase (short-subunit alcohol dehydrogenase family)